MFYRLKDFRRVATRYDRNAANFLAAVCIAATAVAKLPDLRTGFAAFLDASEARRSLAKDIRT